MENKLKKEEERSGKRGGQTRTQCLKYVKL